MSDKFNRRDFIKSSVAAGTASVIASGISPKVFAGDKIDLVVIKGVDYYNNTIKAVNAVGGMKKFVPKGSTVAVLINSPFRNPASL